MTSQHIKKRAFIIAYLAPVLILYFWLMIYPVTQAFITSVYEWNGFSADRLFVGFGNYIRIFQDEIFYKALQNNLFILFWGTMFTFLISIFLAAIITSKPYRERNVLRVLYFVPHALSVSVVAIIWMFIYNPSFGILNAMLDAVGLSFLTQMWLGDKNVIMGALSAPLIWMNVGFFMVLFITSIMDIPHEQYEAAGIDGAGEIKKFIFVTLPNMWEIIRIALVFFVVTAFNYSFEIIYVITRGGPNRASELITTYLYEKAFKTSEYGYASALGVVLFVIAFILISIVMRITRRGDE